MIKEQQQLFKGRDQRKKGWFWIDNDYLNGYAKEFGAIGTAIYISLCRHADNETQKCFPAQEKIAEELNIAVRTVRKYLQLLQSCHIISITRERNPMTKKWFNNIYTLLDKEEWIRPQAKIKRSNIKHSCLICGNNLIEWAHIIPKANGGKGLFQNRVPLCPNHHTLFDKGELSQEELKKIDEFQSQRQRLPMEEKDKPQATKDKSHRQPLPTKETHINKTHSLPDKPADWDQGLEIDKLLTDKQRHINIIGIWIKEMKLRPENKDQMQSIIKRFLRPAKLLEGYKNEDIVETIKVLRNTSYITKFTPETISKYIDEVVANKKKEGPKILRFEKIEKENGSIAMRPIYAK